MAQITFLKDFINTIVFKCEKNQNTKEFAKINNVYKKNIICENEDLKKGDYLIVKTTKDNVHIVKPAETLQSISQKYNISLEELKEKNKTQKVFVGQQLFL